MRMKTETEHPTRLRGGESATNETTLAFPSLLGSPRDDLLTLEQAAQLQTELLAGHEQPSGLPWSITHALHCGQRVQYLDKGPQRPI